jgi:hypothetical protein
MIINDGNQPGIELERLALERGLISAGFGMHAEQATNGGGSVSVWYVINWFVIFPNLRLARVAPTRQGAVGRYCMK